MNESKYFTIDPNPHNEIYGFHLIGEFGDYDTNYEWRFPNVALNTDRMNVAIKHGQLLSKYYNIFKKKGEFK